MRKTDLCKQIWRFGFAGCDLRSFPASCGAAWHKCGAGTEGLTDHSSRDLYGRADPPTHRQLFLPNAGKDSKGLFERTTASFFCWPEVSEQAFLLEPTG